MLARVILGGLRRARCPPLKIINLKITRRARCPSHWNGFRIFILLKIIHLEGNFEGWVKSPLVLNSGELPGLLPVENHHTKD